MKLRVIDQLHVSSVGPHTMGKGTEFDVSDATGADLLKRQPPVVERVAERTAAAPAKAEAAPQNKVERKPKNKAERPPKNKKTGKSAAR